MRTSLQMTLAAIFVQACAADVEQSLQTDERASSDQVRVAKAALTATAPVRLRLIPVRFVQFPSADGPIPINELKENIWHANLVMMRAGVQLYYWANHVVQSSKFQQLVTCNGGSCTEDQYTWPTPLSSSDAVVFNPACTFSHPPMEPEFDALRRAAAYCTYNQEILVYVIGRRTGGLDRAHGGDYPWGARMIGMSSAQMGHGQYVFAHEVGHYLGLPHTFGGGGGFYRDWGLTNGKLGASDANDYLYNPETGEHARLWNFWDLVYKPAETAPATAKHVFFNSELQAAQATIDPIGFYQPIEDPQGDGYLCNSVDPMCPAPGGGFYQPQTMRMDVAMSPSSHHEIFFSGPQLKALSIPSWFGPLGTNVMSYGYMGAPADPLALGISASQITQILRSLRYDIDMKVGPVAGLWGRRPLLGDIWVRGWEGYEMQVDVDLAGNDYSSFEMYEPFPEMCRNACLQEQACKAYTYVGPRNGKPAKCWLKSAAGGRSICTDCVSGDSAGFEVGYNRGGGDYKSFNLNAPLAELCEAACGAETQCRAYTYVKPGIQGPSAVCWLKSSAPGRFADPNATSGVKHSMQNFNIWGLDYSNFASSSEQACMNSCTRDGRCVAYTFVGGSSSRCWLKSVVGELRTGSGMGSGVKRGLDLNTRLSGTTLTTTSPFNGTPRDCQAQCAGASSCVGFNYVDDGTKSCTQLSAVTGSTTAVDKFTWSGLKGMEFF